MRDASDEPVRIGGAQRSQIDALVELNVIVQDLHALHEPGIFAASNRSSLRSHIERLFDDPLVRMWVAEGEGDQLLGFAVAARKERVTPFHHPRRWLELDQIVVAPGARGRGVGRGLLEAVEDYARRSSIAHVELTSWTFNTEAHEFFRRAGYQAKVIRFAKSL